MESICTRPFFLFIVSVLLEIKTLILTGFINLLFHRRFFPADFHQELLRSVEDIQFPYLRLFRFPAR